MIRSSRLDWVLEDPEFEQVSDIDPLVEIQQEFESEYSDGLSDELIDQGNGGSSSYYKLPEWATELDDLIIYKKMPWPIANIFKACYRWVEKHGNSLEYEGNKIGWFHKRLMQHLKEGRL